MGSGAGHRTPGRPDGRGRRRGTDPRHGVRATRRPKADRCARSGRATLASAPRARGVSDRRSMRHASPARCRALGRRAARRPAGRSALVGPPTQLSARDARRGTGTEVGRRGARHGPRLQRMPRSRRAPGSEARAGRSTVGSATRQLSDDAAGARAPRAAHSRAVDAARRHGARAAEELVTTPSTAPARRSTVAACHAAPSPRARRRRDLAPSAGRGPRDAAANVPRHARRGTPTPTRSAALPSHAPTSHERNDGATSCPRAGGGAPPP